MGNWRMTQAELEKEVRQEFNEPNYLSVADLNQKAVMHEHTWFVQKENRPPVDDPVPSVEPVYQIVQP
jgi:hypothetical protein